MNNKMKKIFWSAQCGVHTLLNEQNKKDLESLHNEWSFVHYKV